jgi:hypothetical protein
MRKHLGKLGKAFVGLFHNAATLFPLLCAAFFLFSSAFCHAQPPCYRTQVAVNSITPSTWVVGQTFQIVVTGNNFFDTDYCDLISQVWLTTDTGTADISNIVVDSLTEFKATVTLSADVPAQTAYLYVSCVDSMCGNYVTTPVQINCPTPTITSPGLLPKTWFAGESYNITITGSGFTTQTNATATCPVTPVVAKTSIGSIALSNVTVVSPKQINAIVMPDASDPTELAEITVGSSSNGGAVSVRTQIIGNQIKWNGNLISGINATTQNVVVGQQIALTTITPATTAYDGPTLTPTWTVGGTNIGGYPASTSGASVTPTTLNQTSLTTYWPYAGTNIPVTYYYCANIQGANPVLQCSLPATANFDVIGPTGGSISFTPFAPAVTIANLTTCTDPSGTYPGGPYMIYATGVTGQACPGQSNKTVDGISFNFPTGYTNDSNGIYSLVQLINSDTITGEAVSSYGTGLDTEYPYGWPPSGDSPKVYLQSTATSVTRTFSANMFLMWQSTTANSIPVPLGYQTWGFSGTATCSSNCGTASNWTATTNGTPGPVGSFTPSSASQTQVVNTTLVDGYPTWTSTSQ